MDPDEERRQVSYSDAMVSFVKTIKALTKAERERDQLRAAIREAISALGPGPCDCGAHECGLEDEVAEALRILTAALA